MKKLILLFFAFALSLTPLTACGPVGGKTRIELSEVTHSVFYAPLYVALENGYFEEEDLDVHLTNAGGADKVMTALLSKNAQIGLMGPETCVYVYNQNKADMPKVFAQLTRCDGAFLLSRTPEPDFSLENLRGKDILAGREGGMPAMSFEYVLHLAGLTVGEDLTFNYGVQFNLMTSAFESGVSDYCTMFEPTASEYEKAGKGYIVAAMGDVSGELPYTSFIALSSFLSGNGETVKAFTRALKKGVNYLLTHTDAEVAERIAGQFAGTSFESLKTSVQSYRRVGAWQTDLMPTESAFTRLQDVIEYAGELTERVPFGGIVDTTFVRAL